MNIEFTYEELELILATIPRKQEPICREFEISLTIREKIEKQIGEEDRNKRSEIRGNIYLYSASAWGNEVEKEGL